MSTNNSPTPKAMDAPTSRPSSPPATQDNDAPLTQNDNHASSTQNEAAPPTPSFTQNDDDDDVVTEVDKAAPKAVEQIEETPEPEPTRYPIIEAWGEVNKQDVFFSDIPNFLTGCYSFSLALYSQLQSDGRGVDRMAIQRASNAVFSHKMLAVKRSDWTSQRLTRGWNKFEVGTDIDTTGVLVLQTRNVEIEFEEVVRREVLGQAFCQSDNWNGCPDIVGDDRFEVSAEAPPLLPSPSLVGCTRRRRVPDSYEQATLTIARAHHQRIVRFAVDEARLEIEDVKELRKDKEAKKRKRGNGGAPPSRRVAKSKPAMGGAARDGDDEKDGGSASDSSESGSDSDIEGDIGGGGEKLDGEEVLLIRPRIRML
jgi:hypothetical protein